MPGIRIQHRRLRWPAIALVPVYTKPLFGDSRKLCPTCRVVHPVKTVHLWLEADGGCLVSEGVLADLRSAGMPELDVVGSAPAPPTLILGQNRHVTDNENRRITKWGSDAKSG